MFNLFASLEELLAPVGEPAAPLVGLMVEDWDENVSGVTGAIVELGYNVQVLPGRQVSQEQDASDNGMVPENEYVSGADPQVLFYYKGKPEDVSDEIPVLIVEQGKVKVSQEGKMKELAEYLGLLDNEGEHEYR